MPKLIPLTQGKFAIVDDEDFEVLSNHKWQLHTNGYAYRTVDRKTVLMHRVIMNTPADMHTDHINRDKLLNTRANLRICTGSQNAYNKLKRAGSKSKYKGVVLSKGRWSARITFNGIRMNLGVFSTEHHAAAAYNNKAIELGIENIVLNVLP